MQIMSTNRWSFSPHFNAPLILYRHIKAFVNALQSDNLDAPSDISLNTVPSSPAVPQSPRVRKVSALSDFAPINLKVKRYGSLLSTLIQFNVCWSESEREIRSRRGGKNGPFSCSDGHSS